MYFTTLSHSKPYLTVYLHDTRAPQAITYYLFCGAYVQQARPYHVFYDTFASQLHFTTYFTTTLSRSKLYVSVYSASLLHSKLFLTMHSTALLYSKLYLTVYFTTPSGSQLLLTVLSYSSTLFCTMIFSITVRKDPLAEVVPEATPQSCVLRKLHPSCPFSIYVVRLSCHMWGRR